MKPKPTFTTSIDTNAILGLLTEAPVGATVTYAQIEKKLGRNPQLDARGALQSARKILEKEGVVFSILRNVGLVRLDDSGVVKTAESDIQGIRRKAKRGFTRVSVGVQNYAGLNPEDKMKFNASASILGMLSTSLKPSNIKKIEDRVKGESGALPLMKTLEAFKNA